ncbi:Mu-like prophage major head subunit gpT family protein [Helicobacter sp. 13S00477-4]|uniref:Mu-like prophage major head subunit gpT family protein n=1 Tax=Helicobacter sp. 13S00477-4 TaxID=1905759 RepID=UPI000BA5F175|nr:Mu-like prophage major head subunit gpT family protein [Helicobacter sp. 13S00477-4]PAF51290.1 hypothetical protein BKH44_06175 [Helicobacter sp. 13S00477-4]
MKLDAQTIAEVSIQLSALFNNALEAKTGDYQKIAMEVKANTISVDYRWLAALPSMREWVGDRVLKQIEGYKYLISKKNFESTITVDRDVIAYDSLGIVAVQIKNMAELALGHYDDLVFSLLEANGVCYDGQNFFSDSHMIGTKKFTNISNKALSQASFMQARSEMRGVVNEEGKPLRITPSLLVVPPELEYVGIEILNKQTLKNGETNMTYGMGELYVCPFLNDPKAWYLFDTTKTIKPFVLQKNKEVEFSALDKPDSEANFMRRELRYGIDTEDNAGYGLWQQAFKSDGSSI